jgi:hypothetical protein
MTNETNVEQCEYFTVGSKVLIYGKESTVRGFYVAYNEGLRKYETIILLDGRGDPFERTLESGDLKLLDSAPIDFSVMGNRAALTRQGDETAQGDWQKEEGLHKILMKHFAHNNSMEVCRTALFEILNSLTSRTAKQKGEGEGEMPTDVYENLSWDSAVKYPCAFDGQGIDTNETARHEYYYRLKAEWRITALEAENKRLREGWVAVGDRLPKGFKNVLCISKKGQIRISCVDGSGKLDNFELEVDESDYYTHWQPLPTPPAQQTDNDKNPNP